MAVPTFLTHYYEKARGPLLNLTALEEFAGEGLLETLRQRGEVFASRRAVDYLAVRRGLEETIRRLFVLKGGQPERKVPHYFVLGECEGCKSWYREASWLSIPLRSLDPRKVSFTYGDSFPAMRYRDGKPTRGQVFLLDELDEVVERFGLPQDWNRDGTRGPDRYIEAQVWVEL